MLEQVRSIAAMAGRGIMGFYDGRAQVSFKDDDSPLTLADSAAHQIICEGLTRAFPGVPIISEEGSLPDLDTRRGFDSFWLVDPLDGTKEFIKRNGEFTVNIALIRDGRPVLGVVGLPTRDHFYLGLEGSGASFFAAGRTQPLKPASGRPVGSLRAAISRSHPSAALTAFLDRLPGIACHDLGSSLKFCKVAEGEIDFYPRFGPLNEWDTAAAHAVAVCAGAQVSDLRGGPLSYNKATMKHENLLVSADLHLHEYLLARIDIG